MVGHLPSTGEALSSPSALEESMDIEFDAGFESNKIRTGLCLAQGPRVLKTQWPLKIHPGQGYKVYFPTPIKIKDINTWRSN